MRKNRVVLLMLLILLLSGFNTVGLNAEPAGEEAKMKNELNSKVESIISKVIYMDMDHNTKELMLHDYLVSNTTYAGEGDVAGIGTAEELSSAYSVLIKGRGNSTGYARAMKMLLDKAGIECMIVEGENNVWNIVKIEGDYYHLNASADEFMNREGKEVLTHDYFNMSDQEMAAHFNWDKSKYPACTSTRCNYFIKNNTIVSTVDGFKAQIKNAVLNVQESVGIRVTNFDSKLYDISDTINMVLNENPLLDNVSQWLWVENESIGTVNVIFKYDFPKDIVVMQRNETEKKANEIISNIIKPGMSDYQKVLAVHDYIIKNATYDSRNAENNTIPPEEHDAYGVLIKGIGVCDSYTEAMKLLLDKTGVECITVEGDEAQGEKDSTNDLGHAWNIVKLGENYYHIDTTWDDAGEEESGINARYFYFNVTDDEMKATHKWDYDKYPACKSTEYNYFYQNKLVARDYDHARNMLRDVLSSKNEKYALKIADYTSSGYDIEKLITEAFYKSKLRRLDGARWIVFDGLGIVYIEFQY